MKSALIFVALGLSATTVFGQIPDLDIPDCATTCLIGGLTSTGCELTDFKCACSNQAFVEGSAACIQKSCSAEDQAKSLQVAYQLCKSAGVEIPTTFPQPSVTATGSPTPSASATVSSTITVTGSVGSTLPPVVSVTHSSYGSPSSFMTSNPVPTGTGGAPVPPNNSTINTPTSRPTAPPADGAASRTGASLGAIGLAIAGLLMM